MSAHLKVSINDVKDGLKQIGAERRTEGERVLRRLEEEARALDGFVYWWNRRGEKLTVHCDRSYFDATGSAISRESAIEKLGES